MDRFVAGGVRWWVPGPETHLFRTGPFRDLDALLGSGRVVKDYRIKRTVECVAAGTVYIVKIYKSGGTLRRIRARLLGTRARHELRMYLGVRKRDIPTVPLAAVGERGPEGYVVCEKLGGWCSLEQALLDDATTPRARRRLLEEYGRFARRLHDAGVRQYDFNPSNVLLDPANPGDLRVIDFERMKLGSPVPESARLRTLAKMNRIPRLSLADRCRFLAAYFGGDGLRERLARLVRLVERQARLDAARFARNCTDENRNFGRFASGGWRGYYRKRRPDSPAVGLSPAEVEAVAAGKKEGMREVEAGDAVAAWRRANAAARGGGAVPLAVRLGKEGRRGVLLFAAGDSLDPSLRLP